ncbi:MAG: hypothetical protein MJ153_04740 [Clostridia bacterium]|nr:hypothetical protein [Clostridia bacterium]
MLQDTFIAQMTKRKYDAMNYVFMICICIATLIFVAIVNLVPIFMGYNLIIVTGIITVLTIAGTIYLLLNMSYEYEIEMVNDDITICKIVAKKKRVFLTQFSIRNCISIGPCSSDKYKEALNDKSFILNCTEDRKINPDKDINWFCYVNDENMKYIVVFEFKDEMYQVFRRYNPRGTVVMNIARTKEVNKDE